MGVFALTGEPASGKSMAAALLNAKGAEIFDADECVHGFYRDTGSMVYKKVVRYFPSALKNGVICRDILGDIVFRDPKALSILEGITHPAVIRSMKKWIRQKRKQDGIFIAEVPLLFEKKLDILFDSVILVTVKKDILLCRLMGLRKLTKEDAQRRLGLFKDIRVKQALAGYVVKNNGTKKDFKKKVDLLWEKLKRVR